MVNRLLPGCFAWWISVWCCCVGGAPPLQHLKLIFPTEEPSNATGLPVFPQGLRPSLGPRGRPPCALGPQLTFCEDIDEYPQQLIANAVRYSPKELRELLGEGDSQWEDPLLLRTERPIAITYPDMATPKTHPLEKTPPDTPPRRRFPPTIHAMSPPLEDHLRRRPETEEHPLCSQRARVFYPKAAETESGDWAFVVNGNDIGGRFVQAVQADVCANPDGPCNMLEGVLPYDSVSRCAQKFAYKRLLALHPLERRTVADSFKFPSCCVCLVSRPYDYPFHRSTNHQTPANSRWKPQSGDQTPADNHETTTFDQETTDGNQHTASDDNKNTDIDEDRPASNRRSLDTKPKIPASNRRNHGFFSNNKTPSIHYVTPETDYGNDHQNTARNSENLDTKPKIPATNRRNQGIASKNPSVHNVTLETDYGNDYQNPPRNSDSIGPSQQTPSTDNRNIDISTKYTTPSTNFFNQGSSSYQLTPVSHHGTSTTNQQIPTNNFPNHASDYQTSTANYETLITYSPETSTAVNYFGLRNRERRFEIFSENTSPSKPQRTTIASLDLREGR